MLGLRAVPSSWFLSSETGHQGRGNFRGRGNLLLMVETLFVRCVAPAQEWRFNLCSAVVCGLLFLFSLVSSPRSLFFLAADLQAAPSVRNRTRDLRTLLPAGARGIVRICGIAWTGTGISVDEVCFRGNRRRGCAFGLIGGRWRCGPSARLHSNLRRPLRTHPSGAWMGHPQSPRGGCLWDRLRSLLTPQATECRITTGSRDELRRCSLILRTARETRCCWAALTGGFGNPRTRAA